MKKKLWCVLCIMICMMMIAACGQKKNPEKKKSEKAEQEETEFKDRESLKLSLFTVYYPKAWNYDKENMKKDEEYSYVRFFDGDTVDGSENVISIEATKEDSYTYRKPYVYVGDDDKPAGYDVDILNAVFNKLPDYELEYEVTDFGSVLSGLNSGNYQIGVNNFSYNEDRGASYLYSYPYDKISYVFVTKKGGKEIKSFEDAAGLSFEGGTGISVSNAIEAWNEKNPDKAINITYSDADTSVFLQHVADGSQDFTIIDLAMYNSYMEEFNYDVQKNDIPEDEAKMIAENSYAYYIFPQDQKDLREQVDKVLKELKEDGTLTEISKKWYGQDAAPEDDKFEETIN